MKYLKSFIFLLTLFSSSILYAENKDLKVGFIGSLSGFAADYGTEVLNGLVLAQNLLKAQGKSVQLIVEDDQSDVKNAVGAYQRLVKQQKVDLIISGTWWANSFAKLAEQDSVPLLSCETLHEESTVSANTYFILQGYLKDWIGVYEDLLVKEKVRTAAILRFSSGFGGTLASELEALAVRNDISFLGAVEYQDIEMKEAATLALKIKKLNPDVLYVDAQPSSLANFLSKLAQSGSYNFKVLSNSIVEDVFDNELTSKKNLEGVYFSKRTQLELGGFVEAYQERYGKSPRLSADLGYLALLMAEQGSQAGDLLTTLKNKKISVKNLEFEFDQNRVLTASKQKIFQVSNQEIVAIR